jgi:ABC-type phosphate transport system substrate-binding protein
MRLVTTRRRFLAALVTVTFALAPLDGATPAWANGHGMRRDGYVVIVNEQNGVPSAPRVLVSRFFLKKASHWDSGSLVLPVDLPAESLVRVAFSRHVLGKSVGSIKAYWQQQIFSGREVPPPEKPDEADVLEFVKANRDAIAYVSPDAVLPRGVRVLIVTD